MENLNFDTSDFQKDSEQQIERLIDANESEGMFTIKQASKWINEASKQPIPKMLFGEFWFENEVCILFADTNVGKSILAVQIADSISTGKQIKGFRKESDAQPVLYFDFELSAKQFQNRYSIDYENSYSFNENTIRVEINADADIPEGKTFEDFLNDSFEKSIINRNAKVLIIDNLTYLKNDTEKAKDASSLMKRLRALKNKYHLSILILAHTPKRDNTRPISANDLSGSKMLSNFTDSIFCIGESQTDNRIRYVKQIKVRAKEKNFDSDNVCICSIEKPHNFLLFEFIGYGNEKEHLREVTEMDKGQKIFEVMELKKQGLSNTEISRKYNVSEGCIRKWIKKGDELKSE